MKYFAYLAGGMGKFGKENFNEGKHKKDRFPH